MRQLIKDIVSYAKLIVWEVESMPLFLYCKLSLVQRYAGCYKLKTSSAIVFKQGAYLMMSFMKSEDCDLGRWYGMDDNSKKR